MIGPSFSILMGHLAQQSLKQSESLNMTVTNDKSWLYHHKWPYADRHIAKDLAIWRTYQLRMQ